MRIDVLGVQFDNVTMSEAVARAGELIASGGKGAVFTPNAEIVYLCRGDGKLTETINSAALVIPDGIGVIKGAKVLRRPLKERVPGVEFGENLLPLAVSGGYSLFILGGKPGIAEKAAVRLAEKYPGLKVCGVRDGYFRDDGEVISAINAAAPDILYVCLGAPRQELWIASHADELNVHLLAGLGGSVDIYSGETERAPEFWRRTNLEWFHRLLKQPGRFGRIMSRLPPFMSAVYAQRRAEKKAAGARK